MRVAISFLLLVTVGLGLAPAAAARTAIGQYGRWGAFRDDRAGGCYVIAMPKRGEGFAAVAAPPAVPRLTVRLSRAAQAGSVSALIDGTRYLLSGGGRDAALAGRRMVVVLRGGERLRLSAREPGGRRFVDDYDLAGLPSALDAATIACLPR
ncbi:hypothetical protein [uncultured Sphingomonas sp.]|uniref:hypothetical protein n=1 Tax=uncultured Sphingomonas sp. TaxID=158754 RepID=UPI0025CE4821|nr:hypothetical protein [uncultured Sphingomonas sp.]